MKKFRHVLRPKAVFAGAVLGAAAFSGCDPQVPRALPVPPDVPEANYDEGLVPTYTLPDPLVTEAGEAVVSAGMWQDVRRPEILEMFEREVYGRTPRERPQIRLEPRSVQTSALEGAAIRKEVRVHFTLVDSGPWLDLLIYLPKEAEGPVPIFLGLNFYGNHTINPDPDIALSDQWMRQTDEFGIVENRATEASRGVRASRWPVEQILARGYGLATAYYGDLDPDFDDGFQNGIHPLFYRPDQAARRADAWGSIGAWAWGLSRAMDYLITDSDVDPERVAVMGHSRLGKTALWAGAQDQRFALVVSNDSGAGGAALSRRRFGETVQAINHNFPHWFAGAFTKYDGEEDDLPVDQHMLLSLVAPRPVYVASAEDDQWADPRGEFLSALHAGPVYELLGARGLPTSEWPAVGQPTIGTVGYHIRPGPHDLTLYDWQRFMDFADLHLRR